MQIPSPLNHITTTTDIQWEFSIIPLKQHSLNNCTCNSRWNIGGGILTIILCTNPSSSRLVNKHNNRYIWGLGLKVYNWKLCCILYWISWINYLEQKETHYTRIFVMSVYYHLHVLKQEKTTHNAYRCHVQRDEKNM